MTLVSGHPWCVQCERSLTAKPTQTDCNYIIELYCLYCLWIISSVFIDGGLTKCQLYFFIFIMWMCDSWNEQNELWIMTSWFMKTHDSWWLMTHDSSMREKNDSSPWLKNHESWICPEEEGVESEEAAGPAELPRDQKCWFGWSIWATISQSLKHEISIQYFLNSSI